MLYVVRVTAVMPTPVCDVQPEWVSPGCAGCSASLGRCGFLLLGELGRKQYVVCLRLPIQQVGKASHL